MARLTKAQAETIVKSNRVIRRQLGTLNNFLWDKAKYYSSQGNETARNFYMLKSGEVEAEIAEVKGTIEKYETQFPSLKVKRNK